MASPHTSFLINKRIEILNVLSGALRRWMSRVGESDLTWANRRLALARLAIHDVGVEKRIDHKLGAMLLSDGRRPLLLVLSAASLCLTECSSSGGSHTAHSGTVSVLGGSRTVAPNQVALVSYPFKWPPRPPYTRGNTGLSVDPDPLWPDNTQMYGPYPMCGALGAVACQWFTYESNGNTHVLNPGRIFCGQEGIENHSEVPYPWPSGACTLVRLKGLDMTRSEPGCGVGTSKSCWAKDDQDRDQLSFNTDALSYVTHVGSGTKLADGRYIYVVRSNWSEHPPGDIIVRRYDRANDGGRPTCPSYSQFRASQNWRNGNQQYLHVRHSQLVGNDTDMVLAAGELRVKNGQVDRINNGSGHYQPQVEAISHALRKLDFLGIPIAASLIAGSWDKVSAAEDNCTPAPFEPPVDDDQQLKDEL